MRRNFIILGIVFIVMTGVFLLFQAQDVKGSSNTGNAAPKGSLTKVVLTGNFANVEVDQSLYYGSNPNQFYICVKVTNTSTKPIGVKLDDKNKVVYANQCIASDAPTRQIINERRMVLPAKMPLKINLNMLDLYASGKLVMIKPRETIKYFRAFTRSGRTDIEKMCSNNSHLIIIVDGQLMITDGTTVEWLRFGQNTIKKREVAIQTPVIWKNVPKNSTVLE